ncbi:unnamed protein product [Urochloa humidicola]
MARWSASTAAAVATVLGASLLYLALAASAQPPPPSGNMQVISMNGKRNSKFTCADTKKNSKRPGCTASDPAPAVAPKKCLVLCPTCKTFCRMHDPSIHPLIYLSSSVL